MTLTSARPRRSNGIPTTKTITNVSNEDGTFTRTTDLVYSNGTEITTKETLTALEIEQLENQDSSATEGSLSSTREDESDRSSSSFLDSFMNHNDDSFVLYHVSTLLILFSFVCAILALLIRNSHQRYMHENTFASVLSFFCSFIAIPMMYNLGSDYMETGSENGTWSMTDKWIMTWITALSGICFLFSIFYFGIILFIPDSCFEFTIVGTLWNIMTFSIVAGRAEYLLRKQRNDEIYEVIHTFPASYTLSFFLFIVSMMNGYTCTFSMMIVAPMWQIQTVVMWIIYILFSKVAFVLMFMCCGRHRKQAAEKIDASNGEEVTPLITHGDGNDIQSFSLLGSCSRLHLLSVVMYIIGFAFDLSDILYNDVNGLKVFVCVSWNAIPWLLIETSGKLCNGQIRLKSSLDRHLHHM